MKGKTIPKVGLDPHLIKSTTAQFGVAHVANAGISPGELVDFLRSFGDLMFTDGETPVDGFPDLNIVTNGGRTTKPKSVFHSDTTYVLRPPSITALMAIDVPQQGGATLFCNQYDAYDELSDTVKERYEGARVLHRVTGVEPKPGSQTEAWHPLIRTHPDSGRKSLFLTTPARCISLILRDGTDATAETVSLYERSKRNERVVKHEWQEGDLIFWDNRCTMHAADHSAVVGLRTLYRGMVQGETPA